MSYQQLRLPKKRNTFLIQVQRADGTTSSALDIFSHQTVAVDVGSENLGLVLEKGQSAELSHRTNRIVLWVEDDFDNDVMTAIRLWQKMPKPLRIVLVITDGADHAKEVYNFGDAWFEALQHSMWTYTPSAEQINLQLKQDDDGSTATLEGTVTSGNSKDLSMKLIQVSFKEYGHFIPGEPMTIAEAFK